MVPFIGFLAWCFLQEVDVAAALGLGTDDHGDDWTDDLPLRYEPIQREVVWEEVNDPVEPPRRVPYRSRSRCH